MRPVVSPPETSWGFLNPGEVTEEVSEPSKLLLLKWNGLYVDIFELDEVAAVDGLNGVALVDEDVVILFDEDDATSAVVFDYNVKSMIVSPVKNITRYIYMHW